MEEHYDIILKALNDYRQWFIDETFDLSDEPMVEQIDAAIAFIVKEAS